MTVPPRPPPPQPRTTAPPRGYSAEAERAIRLSTPPVIAPPPVDVTEAISAVEAASDSKGMSAALLRPAYLLLLRLMGEGKVGASDLIRIASMSADRVDGKVIERVETTGTTHIERSITVRFIDAPMALAPTLPDVDAITASSDDESVM